VVEYEPSFYMDFSNVAAAYQRGGEYRYLYPPPPKKTQVHFLWGKNDVRKAIQQFYTPKNFYTPKTNFWLRPCNVGGRVSLEKVGDGSSRSVWSACVDRGQHHKHKFI